VDIHAYLKRIQYQGSLEPTKETLHALHEAHMLMVPFENLSIHYGQPIILQEDALYEKVVRRERGGFCYELNGLFAVLLRTLGFKVTMLSAAMAHATGEFGPETDHAMLLVHLSEDWLADVGNGNSFRKPLLIQEAQEYIEYIEGEHAYRMDRDGIYWILQKRVGNDIWKQDYRFTPKNHELADFVDRCSYYQTSPESYFKRNRICSRATPTGRITLKDLQLITTIHGEKEEQTLRSEEEYREMLARRFGVVV
jgi:N-hydroxyarylamine O-acetyltransferase